MRRRDCRLRPAVVLVADRTLSGDYTVLFEAIFATMQTTTVPSLFMRQLVSPKVTADAAGRAEAAPLGLRRVEAAIRRDLDLGADEVVCTTPERLDGLLGPWTRLVCASSSDPLGRGMSNTTTAAFCGGELYTRRWTRRLMHRLRRAKEKHSFVVMAGGQGTWQYRLDPQAAAEHGVDCLFEGYFEAQGPELVRRVLEGEPPPTAAVETRACAEAAAPILAPSLLGAVELSRGCGKGCSFCVAGRMRMEHLPVDRICADVETNVAGGRPNVVNTSEDLFRYGAAGPQVNFDRLHELLTAMRRIEGLRFMQIDHANVSSVLQLTDAQLTETARLLRWEAPCECLWVNLGVESANGRLVAAAGPGKVLPFDPADWEEMVEESVARLNRTGFFPVVSLVLGLPGETPADVARTHRLVDRLRRHRLVVFPVFHEPVRAGERFSLERMRPEQFDLFRDCYEINFRGVPELYGDNQRAGGVPWARRALVQALGRVEMIGWRRRFRRIGRQVKAAACPRPAAAGLSGEVLDA